MNKRWPLVAMSLLLCSPTITVAQGTESPSVARYRAAAERGNADAQYALGEAYYDGQGVAQDRQQAVRWFRAAAEQGHAEAQYSLGFVYQLGRGVPVDPSEALAWYQKAAAQGHRQATSTLKAMQSAPAKSAAAPNATLSEGFGGKASTPEQMQARMTLLAAIPDSEAIVFQPKGKVFGVYTIFVDPKCLHCAALFNDTARLTSGGNRVRYVLAWDSDISQRIWCSADRGAALKAAFQAAYGGKSLLPKCASSFATRFEKTSQTFGVSVTPTTFTERGRVQVGYTSLEEMLFNIDESYIWLLDELQKRE